MHALFNNTILLMTMKSITSHNNYGIQCFLRKLVTLLLLNTGNDSGMDVLGLLCTIVKSWCYFGLVRTSLSTTSRYLYLVFILVAVEKLFYTRCHDR